MFDRFTEEARQVVVDAQAEARLMRHGHVGTEHLLVALAGRRPLTLPRERARAEVVKAVGLGEAVERETVPFTAAAQAALEAALPEAMQLGHSEVEPAHILLGLLRQRDGIALRVLTAAGAGPRELRDAVTRDLAAPRDGAIAASVAGDTPGTVRGDTRALFAIFEADGAVAAWLRERGVTEDAVRRLL
jgi:ATP-dependent Clp protease ATP-binding subunit ClpC